jgi:hypothetical protein
VRELQRTVGIQRRNETRPPGKQEESHSEAVTSIGPGKIGRISITRACQGAFQAEETVRAGVWKQEHAEFA